MDELSTRFLPFPHVYKGERREGATHHWPDRCDKCDRQCERAGLGTGVIGLCAYGVNFVRVDESVLIAGIVVREDPRATKARGKMLKTVGRNSVPTSHLDSVLMRATEIQRVAVADLEKEKLAILDEYRRSGDYKHEIVDLLRPSLEQTFAQVHDYKALISQIIQNVNVLLETATPGSDLDSQLDRAAPPVRSIYWAARLMEFKLQSALFLVYPARITDPRHKVYFKLHGAIYKYLAIYRPLMERRGLRAIVTGESHSKLAENPDAIGVIPHAFIDNAVKYAPDGSELHIHFSEDQDSITVQVSSPGPKIRSDERQRLFELFYRGAAAKDSAEDGTGFGLGLAQHVADAVGASLTVAQDSKASVGTHHLTTFTATFRKPAADDRPPSIVSARARRRGGPS
jgi:signal transduction histidine kinase